MVPPNDRAPLRQRHPQPADIGCSNPAAYAMDPLPAYERFLERIDAMTVAQDSSPKPAQMTEHDIDW